MSQLVADVDAVRDAAIEQAGDAASPEWLSAAFSAIRYLANTREDFTSDDVWAELDIRGVRGPREPRALGSVLTALRHEGRVVPTAEYRKSTRRACHGRPIRVWKRGR